MAGSLPSSHSQSIQIFISYSQKDEDLKEELDEHLANLKRQNKISVWDDRAIEAGQEWKTEVKKQLESAKIVLLLVSPHFMASNHCYEYEMQKAIDRHNVGSARVLPILLKPVDWQDAPFSQLQVLPSDKRPVSAWDDRNEAFLHVANEIRRAVNSLSRPALLRRDISSREEHLRKKLGDLWNVPKLPPNFLPRKNDLAAIREKLRLINHSVVVTGISHNVSVQGMGGIGKSVLAVSAARDMQVRRAFPDGVFWLTLGQEPRLLENQVELAKALGDEQPEISTLQEGKVRLGELFNGKACLLILDDVWQVSDLAALDVVSLPGKLLITTRDARIATSICATEHQIGMLNLKQAQRLLARWTGLSPSAFPPEADEVVTECDCLPLALTMVGAMLRGKATKRWSNVLEKLKSADLDEIHHEFPHYPYPNLMKVIQVSVEALETEIQDRYLDFAVFPEDVLVPEAVLQIFWSAQGLSARKSQDIIDRMESLSLLQKDETDRVMLHDLQADYIRGQVEDLSVLHQCLLTAYQQQCREGWHTGPQDGYFFEYLPYHLKQAGKVKDLQALLLDFNWMRTKLEHTSISALITDYTLLSEFPSVALVHSTLKLSAHILAHDKTQLAGRLWGHLQDEADPAIQHLLLQVQELYCSSWLRPLLANLSSPRGPLLQTLKGHHASVRSIAIAPDGRYAVSASASQECALKVWDLEQGIALRTLHGHNESIRSVVISPDGKKAVSASKDRTLKTWDLERGVELQTLTGHRDALRSVKITPDGKQAVSASDDGTLKIWDLERGIELRTLEGHGYWVRSVAVTPDGRRAVSASEDHTLKIWDLEHGTELQTLRGHTDVVRSVRITTDGERALSVSEDGTLKIWDLKRGVELRTLKGHRKWVRAVAITPDGRRAVTASEDLTLRIWDLEQGIELGILEGHNLRVRAVAITPNGKRVISASDDYTLKIWDIEQRIQPQRLEGHSDSVRAVAFAPDGQRVLSASEDHTLKVWDLQQGILLQTFRGHDDWVRAVAIAPNGKVAVSASEDHSLKLWDLETGNELETLLGHEAMVRAVAIAPDGKVAVSGSEDCSLKIWDLDGCYQRRTLKRHRGKVRSVAITPDGRFAVSASGDRTLKVWELETGNELRTLRGHSDSVRSVAITPDSQLAISASSDRTMKIWNLNSGLELRTLSGHCGWVRCVMITPDGQRVISASQDHTLKLWDLHTGELITSFTGDSEFFSCTISPDGSKVVAGDAVGKVHFFQLEESSSTGQR